jgi:hypothetical protein
MARGGPPGRRGVQGYSELSGDGPPAADLGNVGDHYTDNLTLDRWGPKDADGWGDEPSGSLLGPLLIARVPVAEVETGDFTFDPALHLNRIVPATKATEQVMTLPADAEEGDGCTVLQRGAGRVRFVLEGGGAPGNAHGHTRSLGPHALVTCLYADGAWTIAGSTEE